MTQTKQERLTLFLQANIPWPRRTSPYWTSELDGLWGGWEVQPWLESRPTAEELAAELLRNVEFRALELGAWLTTPDGRLVAAAVEAMAPPLYQSDVELLVAALQLAALGQQAEGQRRAQRALVGALSVAALGLVIRN